MIRFRSRGGRGDDVPVAPLPVGSGRVRLSSPATPWLRLIVLAPLGGGAAFFAAQASARDMPGWGLVLAAFVFVAITGFTMVMMGLLWNVWLDDNLLICKRFTARKEIPLSEIKDVALRRVGDDSRIRITLRDFSSYGRGVTFMPVDFKRRKGKPAQIVALLRQRAGLDAAGPGARGRAR